MPQSFKLIKEEFSKVDQEWQWTYLCLIELILNRKKISKITVTDHTWRKKGREKITKELILAIFQEELNGKIIKPSEYLGNRIVYTEEKIEHQGKKYKIVFWFENNDPNWLWVRTCHQQD
jgi:hypothetical protein